jgi:hypothetical protein
LVPFPDFTGPMTGNPGEDQQQPADKGDLPHPFPLAGTRFRSRSYRIPFVSPLAISQRPGDNGPP